MFHGVWPLMLHFSAVHSIDFLHELFCLMRGRRFPFTMSSKMNPGVIIFILLIFNLLIILLLGE